MKITVFCNT